MAKKIDAQLARLRAPKDAPRPEDADVYTRLREVAARMTGGLNGADSFNALVAAAILDLDARLGGKR